MTTKDPILVTGAAGFIGSHLCETLLKNNQVVVGIDNLDKYYSPEIKKFNLSLLQKYQRFTFKKLDILEEKNINRVFQEKKPSFLIHCAARAGVRESARNPLPYTKTNVYGTHILLEAIRLYSPETKAVLFSTSSVYGVQKEVPFREEMAPNPQSPYSLSKHQMELLAKLYFQFYQVSCVVIRPFSIYGPRGRLDMAPFLLIKAAENSEPFIKFGTNQDNRRDWTYIDDFVEGVAKLLKRHDFSRFEIFNFGHGQPMGIDDFVRIEKELIKKYLKKDLKVLTKERGSEELAVTHADISTAKAKIGYSPKIALKQGLTKFIKFYCQNRPLYLKAFLGIPKPKNKARPCAPRIAFL